MTKLNRRHFLQSSGSLCFIGAAHGSPPTQIAYVGCDDAIHVYSVNETWRRIQTVSSRKPALLLLHPTQPLLFVANDIEEHNNLPRATVETFGIDEAGRLRPINQVALSLSAIRPRHLAIAPQTNHLVVSSSAAGIYNVLAFDAGGRLTKPTHIRKETGCGIHPRYQTAAHPHSCLFDSTGNLLTSDLGCDRFSVFRLRAGKLIRSSQLPAQPGDGPGPLAIDSSRSVLYVLNILNASVSQYAYAPQSGSMGREIVRWPIPLSGNPINHGSLALAGSNLVVAVNKSNGSLLAGWSNDKMTNSLRADSKAFYSLVAHPDGQSWLAVDRAAGRIVAVDADLQLRQVAKVNRPLCLTFQRA